MQKEKLAEVMGNDGTLDIDAETRKEGLSGDEKQYLAELIKTIKTRIAR